MPSTVSPTSGVPYSLGEIGDFVKLDDVFNYSLWRTAEAADQLPTKRAEAVETFVFRRVKQSYNFVNFHTFKVKDVAFLPQTPEQVKFTLWTDSVKGVEVLLSRPSSLDPPTLDKVTDYNKMGMFLESNDKIKSKIWEHARTAFDAKTNTTETTKASKAIKSLITEFFENVVKVHVADVLFHRIDETEGVHIALMAGFKGVNVELIESISKDQMDQPNTDDTTVERTKRPHAIDNGEEESSTVAKKPREHADNIQSNDMPSTVSPTASPLDEVKDSPLLKKQPVAPTETNLNGDG
eukprot:GHVS01036644.1.p1 GENE.GHVS01036644.1~~GHVS01036644.1.p1  ORF type:complete len:328 (+),score=35.96 GHVS01036644.1:101-985(+)